MDHFAEYDHDASELADPQRFWDEVEDILTGHAGGQGSSDANAESSSSGIVSSEPTLFARLSSFYALCDTCYDTHLDHQNNADYLLTRLIDSTLLAEASSQSECSATLVSLATSAKSLPALYLIYETIVKYGTRYPSVFGADPSTKLLIPRLIHHFWAARYAEEYMEREAALREKGMAGSSNGASDANGKANGAGVARDWHLQLLQQSPQSVSSRQATEARDRRLHCRLRDKAVRLLYEISRSQKLNLSNLRVIDATFINHLFELVEASRNWQDDTYNYQLIKLIIALNEQFMVSALSEDGPTKAATNTPDKSPTSKKTAVHATNTVMTVLRTRLNASKTFGENVIFMLNRASSLNAEDVCMQLLLLKLLYLLFTTKETAHYFYTNDLKVLVDIFIRELSDLSEEHESLRHTYLRVMHPLLTNTQLLTYPYKRMQIRKLLINLTSHALVREISPTTQRLVERCLTAQWCVDLDRGDGNAAGGVPRLHHFSVQSIGGGEITTVEAPVVTDAEGISIPLVANMEPYLGAPKKEGTEAAVANAEATEFAHDDNDASQPSVVTGASPLGPDEPTHPPSQRSTQERRRRSMSNNVSSPVLDLREKAMRTQAMHYADAPMLRSAEAGPSDGTRSALPKSISNLNTRLNGRASSMQLRTQSSVDVSNMAGDDEVDDDDGKWEAGAGSSSWHQSMASEDAVARASAIVESSGEAGIAVPEAEAEMTTSATGTQSLVERRSSPFANQDNVDKRDLTASSLIRVSGRRAPPAPPVEPQKVRVRSERDGGKYAASEHDSTLSLSGESSERSAAASLGMRLDSGTESSSREASPLMIAQRRMVRTQSNSGAAAAGTASPTPSLRRRPPPPPHAITTSTIVSPVEHPHLPPSRKVPPPVDRSTKSSRLQVPASGSSALSSRRGSYSSQTADTASDSSTLRRVGGVSSATAAPNEYDPPIPSPITEMSAEAAIPADDDAQGQNKAHHLSEYMDQLHVSGTSPYGWS